MIPSRPDARHCQADGCPNVLSVLDRDGYCLACHAEKDTEFALLLAPPNHGRYNGGRCNVPGCNSPRAKNRPRCHDHENIRNRERRAARAQGYVCPVCKTTPVRTHHDKCGYCRQGKPRPTEAQAERARARHRKPAAVCA